LAIWTQPFHDPAAILFKEMQIVEERRYDEPDLELAALGKFLHPLGRPRK
jgi:hypothetical protein